MSDQFKAPSSKGGTGSVAAIVGHPLHPMMVPVAIGMYVAATCADIAYARSGDTFWALGTSWLLLGSLVSGAIAAIPGMIDFVSIPRAQRLHIAWAHAGMNLLFLAVTAVNYGWRQSDPAAPLGSSGLALTLLGFGLMAVSGWLGGEMSYRHGIGVTEHLDVSAGKPPH